MKKGIIVLMVFYSLGVPAMAQQWDDSNTAAVQQFIYAIKDNDTNYLKQAVRYPLERSYPLIDIQDTLAFTEQYAALFDKALKESIASSSIEDDWAIVGYQGIMFDRGTLWLDEQGKLIRLNNETALEKEQRQQWIDRDKLQRHASVNDYESPVLLLRTAKFDVRIDATTDGNYRYASWPAQTDKGQAPDLILSNGQYVREGTGGNHSYVFKNGAYTYLCGIHRLGTSNTPPASLTVYKNDQEIGYEPAVLVPPINNPNVN